MSVDILLLDGPRDLGRRARGDANAERLTLDYWSRCNDDDRTVSTVAVADGWWPSSGGPGFSGGGARPAEALLRDRPFRARAKLSIRGGLHPSPPATDYARLLIYVFSSSPEDFYIADAIVFSVLLSFFPVLYTDARFFLLFFSFSVLFMLRPYSTTEYIIRACRKFDTYGFLPSFFFSPNDAFP